MIKSKTNSLHSPLTVAFAGALVIAAAMGIGRFAYTPLLPGLQEALGWTVAQAGDVASANYLGYLLGAMFASLLVHHQQRRFAFLVGILSSALTTLACAFITSYLFWMGLRFLSGFASAFCMVLGTAIVLEVFIRHQRPQLISTYFAGLSVGIIGSVLIVEVARSLDYSIFVQWGILGFASIIMLGLAWVVLGSLTSDEDDHASVVTNNNSVFSNIALRRLIIAYGLFGFGYVVTATFIVAIARDIDSTAFLEPAVWIVVGLVGAPSIYVWQYFSSRFGVFMALRVAYAIEAAGVLLAGIADSAAGVIVGGAMLGGTFMAITSMGSIAAREVADGNHNKAFAWMTVSFGIGQLFGPAVAGRMAESTQSFAASSALAAFLLLVGAVLIKNKN